MTIQTIRKVNRTRSLAYRRSMARLHSNKNHNKRVAASIEFYCGLPTSKSKGNA